MTKRFLIFSLSILFLVVGLISPLADNVFSASAPQTPLPPQSDSVMRVPTSVPAGFYISNSQWHMLTASNYSATGAFQFWSWESLNPDRNLYRFDKIDQYINAAVSAGYQSVGIAITTYNGRTAQYYPCTGDFNQGFAQTPYFVRWGPDGIAGTADDPVVVADTPDIRDCDGDGIKDPWLLPKYTDAYYTQQYQLFVNALADHFLNAPNRDRIAWVALGTGKDGENIPVNNSDDDALLRVISVDNWKDFVRSVITIYHDAFAGNASKPQIPLLLQNAPFYRYASERRDLAEYANSKDVGVSVNGITSDFDLTEACDGGGCIGIYDQVRLYNDTIPIGLESYGYMMASENEFYWAMARAIDLKPDFVRLSSFWNDYDTPVNRITAQWASRYIGKGLDASQNPPPSIWSRMREHRDPIYLPYLQDALTANYWPTIGNYEYFLTQDHQAPHGVTLPYTDDPRFQASDHRFGTTRYPDTRSQPWHYNPDGYSATLNSAGLYHAAAVKSGGVAVQVEVDPGWTARRSDQADGNYGFFFDADDRYLSAPADINAPHQIRITITWLDHGNDRWRLMYDSVSGEKAATLYAIRDWDVRTGLAIEDGLPVSGILPDPKPTYVQKTNTNHWKVATFYIQDGYFGNRLAGGNDFYIDSRNETGMMDGDDYIHHVDVQKLNNVPQTTPTPTATPSGPTATPTATPSGPTATPTPVGATATPTATPSQGDASISGYVFENHNGDYTKDADEPGLPGALVTLYHENDLANPVSQTVTDNDGAFIFNTVLPNTYIILTSPPIGWEMILASRYVVIQAGQHISHQDFPARHTATPTPTASPTPVGGRINGIVFADDNADGALDPGESGVSDVSLRLETFAGQLVDETQSDADGHYHFSDLSDQTYHLFVLPPAGWSATTLTDVLLNPAGATITQNFGLLAPPTPTPTPTPAPSGQFNAFVWNDLDQDGVHDDGEPPLAGAEIIIFDGSGQTEIARDVTGGDGYARFDLPAPTPTDYTVQEMPPVGLSASTPVEYAFILHANSSLEIPFGNYDASTKVYLPLITRLAP